MKVSKSKVMMVTESPDGRKQTTWLPQAIGWAAARGVALWTRHEVTLAGARGRATFNGDGSGTVEWFYTSTTPVTISHFDERTTVCIN